MEKKDEIFLKNLLDKGLIDSLRRKIISVLLTVEDINAELNLTKDNKHNEVDFFTGRIESFLEELSDIQKMADSMILGMDDGQRKILRQIAPELMEIFGWLKRTKEDGGIDDNG